jgi:hypothetical protein
MAAGAFIDRLLHHAQVIAINDKSNRVKEAPVVTRENKKGRKSNEAATGGPRAKARSSARTRLFGNWLRTIEHFVSWHEGFSFPWLL